MKKIFLSTVLIFILSTAANAQNYTLQVNQSDIQTPVKTSLPSRSTSSAMDAFCSGMSDFLSPSQSYSNSTVRNIENPIDVSYTGVHHDPYLIEINGVRYMMIKDNNDGVFDRNDILGINDTTKTVFASLLPIDFNGDRKLTGEELSKANIRLVKIGQNGKLIFSDKSQDFKNSDIVFIHLTELRKSYKNNGNSGDFGFYDVVIKDSTGNKQLVTGVVSFESEAQIKGYFE